MTLLFPAMLRLQRRTPAASLYQRDYCFYPKKNEFFLLFCFGTHEIIHHHNPLPSCCPEPSQKVGGYLFSIFRVFRCHGRLRFGNRYNGETVERLY